MAASAHTVGAEYVSAEDAEYVAQHEQRLSSFFADAMAAVVLVKPADPILFLVEHFQSLSQTPRAREPSLVSSPRAAKSMRTSSDESFGAQTVLLFGSESVDFAALLAQSSSGSLIDVESLAHELFKGERDGPPSHRPNSLLALLLREMASRSAPYILCGVPWSLPLHLVEAGIGKLALAVQAGALDRSDGTPAYFASAGGSTPLYVATSPIEQSVLRVLKALQKAGILSTTTVAGSAACGATAPTAHNVPQLAPPQCAPSPSAKGDNAQPSH